MKRPFINLAAIFLLIDFMTWSILVPSVILALPAENESRYTTNQYRIFFQERLGSLAYIRTIDNSELKGKIVYVLADTLVILENDKSIKMIIIREIKEIKLEDKKSKSELIKKIKILSLISGASLLFVTFILIPILMPKS